MKTSRAAAGSMRAERDAAPRHQRESVELHALARDDLAALGVPVRLEVVARHAIAGDRLDPLRLDLRRAARVEPRRLDELGGEHPFRPLPREPGSRDAGGTGCRARRGSPRPRRPACRRCRAAPRAAPGGSLRSAPRRSPRAAPASTSSPARPPRVASCACTSRHSREPQVRDELRAAGVDQPAVRQLLARASARRTPTARASDRKSERSSRKRRCAWSAACCFSSGRSRGSGTDSALAMTSTSARQPRSRAARIMRPMRGSTGSRASSRPSGVSARFASTAPSSCSSW